MLLNKAIIDNTVFNLLVKIQSVDLENIIRSVISEYILVPSEVLIEMEQRIPHAYPEYQPRIMRLSEQTRANNYFKLCTSYDGFIYDEVKRFIDKGEADAIAQSAKTGVRLFITDDKECQLFILGKYSHIRLHSTFFIIMVADVSGLIRPEDYNNVFVEYHKIIKYEQFKSTTKREHKAFLRKEYASALEYVGFRNNKRVISNKTSVDTILRNAN